MVAAGRSRRLKSEVLCRQQQSIPFWLRDSTGQAPINPDGAVINTIEVLNELRPEPPQHLGRSQFDSPASESNASNTDRTLSYRYRKSLLTVGRSVLVVGTASDLTGQVVVGQPVPLGHQSLISLKTEEAPAAVTRKAPIAFWAMVICLVSGTVLIWMGLLLPGT